MAEPNSAWEVAQVARGEVATITPAELAHGSAITSSGRISAVTEPGELSVHYPFPINDLVTLDDALTYGSRAAGARFAVYIGDLGSDTGARAREILAKVPTPNDAVLIAVSPNQHVIEVVYGSACPRPWGRVGRAARCGRSGVVVQGRPPDRRSCQRGPGDQRRHFSPLRGRAASVRPLRHRRIVVPVATSRPRRGPRAPVAAVPGQSGIVEECVCGGYAFVADVPRRVQADHHRLCDLAGTALPHAAVSPRSNVAERLE